MRPTVEYLYQKFDYYNHLCFGGRLPRIPIRLNRSTRLLGMACFKRRNGKVLKDSIVIKISVLRDNDEELYINTLVHEMIHCYIMYFDIQDSSQHGKVFKSIMREINSKYGLHIDIRHEDTETAEEASQRFSNRARYVCSIEFDNGSFGLAIVPSTRLFEYWHIFDKEPNVKRVRWYGSYNAVLERYKTVRRPAYYLLTREQMQLCLTDATELINTGREIRPQ